MNIANTQIEEPWLITLEAYRTMISTISLLDGMDPKAIALFETSHQIEEAPYDIEDGIAIIPIYGTLKRKPTMMEKWSKSATSSIPIIKAIRHATTNSQVKAVILDIDSPGGTVNGTPELANAVRNLKKEKWCYAFTAGQMCSAAYWIASQADAIFVAPSSIVGSIGVLLAFYDYTGACEKMGLKAEVFTGGKFKSTGLPGTTLSEEQRAELQNSINEIYGDFKSAVTERRKVAVECMEGQTFSGKVAITNGLADALVDDIELVKAKVRKRHC